MALTEINSKSIKDGEILEEDISISNTPSDGQFLQYKDTTDKLTWADVATSTIPVADEGTDTECYPVFTTTATGDQAPKTNANLTYNSNTGSFTAASLASTNVGGLSLIHISEPTRPLYI